MINNVKKSFIFIVEVIISMSTSGTGDQLINLNK